MELVLAALLAYAVVGSLVGGAFALRGAGAIDPQAQRTSLRTRLILVPGAAALWPWVLTRWVRASGGRRAGGRDPGRGAS
jgi:hypothetical protein